MCWQYVIMQPCILKPYIPSRFTEWVRSSLFPSPEWVPNEILSDQGTNFMSQLLQEILSTFEYPPNENNILVFSNR